MRRQSSTFEVSEMDLAEVHNLAATAVDQLIAAVEAGQSRQLKEYLAMLVKFHRYSVSNLFLIMAQCPDASQVAGYRTWQGMGRQVRRGSKAIRILAPVVRKMAEEDDRQEEVVVAFRTVNVFDVSQTEGEPLIEFPQVQGDPGRHASRLKCFIASRGIKLRYSNALGAAEGVSRGGVIVLRPGLPPAKEFSVLAHELAHEFLHHDGKGAEPRSKTVRETEAEAVAFVVCQAAGLEVGSAASDYIQLYQGKRETLLASLERIRRVAALIIRGVEPEGRQAAA